MLEACAKVIECGFFVLNPFASWKTVKYVPRSGGASSGRRPVATIWSPASVAAYAMRTERASFGSRRASSEVGPSDKGYRMSEVVVGHVRSAMTTPCLLDGRLISMEAVEIMSSVNPGD